MKGNMIFNFVFGAVGFVVTFLFSLGNNLIMTSMIRGVISFAIWFVLAFILRWVWGAVSIPEMPSTLNQTITDEARGSNLDLTIPDESNELNELLKPKPDSYQEGGSGFTPLDPPKLVTAKDPEELAKAVRHLTDK